MTKERIINWLAWVILGSLLLCLVPGARVREALVVFSFKQTISWLFGLVVAEMGLIEYPVRYFPRATQANFLFEFFAYPAICVFFNLYYPFGASGLVQGLHYVVYSSAVTAFEVILEKRTQLVRYTHWAWYWSWLTLAGTFWLSNLFYRWYFYL